jgi:hypothetical protein
MLIQRRALLRHLSLLDPIRLAVSMETRGKTYRFSLWSPVKENFFKNPRPFTFLNATAATLRPPPTHPLTNSLLFLFESLPQLSSFTSSWLHSPVARFLFLLFNSSSLALSSGAPTGPRTPSSQLRLSLFRPASTAPPPPPLANYPSFLLSFVLVGARNSKSFLLRAKRHWSLKRFISLIRADGSVCLLKQ